VKVSYLVTCSNETDTLKKLLLKLIEVNLDTQDEIIVLLDKKYSNIGDPSYEIIANHFHDYCGIPTERGILEVHDLNNDYGAHKNFGIEQCSGDYIFQLDGDEMPPDCLLGESLHELLESNPTIEAYAVPRINDFKGVTPEHAKQWGWRLTKSPTYKRPLVNWPDYQFRIFKRDYPRISFLRKLHEKIEGYSSYSTLPPEEDWAIYHDKTIEKQIQTNLRYNKDFSQQENQGHNVFGK
jgi:glycosyltransferase involved in cell wall biosynthesis